MPDYSKTITYKGERITQGITLNTGTYQDPNDANAPTLPTHTLTTATGKDSNDTTGITSDKLVDVAQQQITATEAYIDGIADDKLNAALIAAGFTNDNDGGGGSEA